MTSGGGNSSEFVVFHYSAQLNFWLLCRRFFFGGMRVTLLKKRNCIAVSMN